MKIKNLENIHEISTKYDHEDKSFEDYDYDVHQCNQAQYEDYQNDSKSTDKNLINNDMHKETKPIIQACVKVKNLSSMDNDLKNPIIENESMKSMNRNDNKDKSNYDFDFDMSHHKKAIEQLENESVRKLKTLH